MRRSFNALFGRGPGASPGQLKLRIFLLVLLLLNAAAFYFYFDPPGGSQQELADEDAKIENQIAALNVNGAHLQTMARRVETGSIQISEFEKQYFLPKRIAYGAVIEEIQRMAKASGLQERDAGFSEEPIEGTNDLSLLTIKANYEGAYPSMIKFLYETDRSPMLLMLDSLTAAPEQKNGQISADIRFQVVIQDQPLAVEQQVISDQIKKEQALAEQPPTSFAKVEPVTAAPRRAVPDRASPPKAVPDKAGPVVRETVVTPAVPAPSTQVRVNQPPAMNPVSPNMQAPIARQPQPPQGSPYVRQTPPAPQINRFSPPPGMMPGQTGPNQSGSNQPNATPSQPPSPEVKE